MRETCLRRVLLAAVASVLIVSVRPVRATMTIGTAVPIEAVLAIGAAMAIGVAVPDGSPALEGGAERSVPLLGSEPLLGIEPLLGNVQSLNGEWQRATTPEAVNLPPTQGWEKISVPNAMHLRPAEGARSLWYRREISMPDNLGDRRVFVELRAAFYMPEVFVDGQRILPELQSDGWSPQVVEITQAVRAGSVHNLVVRCHDRSVFFEPGFVLKEGMKNDESRGKVTSLVGGYKDNVGLADSVLLRIAPSRCIDPHALELVTSTRKSQLSLSGRVLGAPSGLDVSVEVLDGTDAVLRVPGTAVTSEGAFAVEVAFPGAKFWSPENPHLYQLRVTLSDSGKVVDVHTQRFGFKEVWTQGPDFYLNGVKRRLLASSTWPVTEYVDPAEVRRRVQMIKDSNTIAFRLHIGGWQQEWYDAADELGLLIIPEAACYTDGDGMYAYKNPVFWKNYERHLAGMIRRDRNRACLAMYSLGNEILFMGNKRHDADLPRKLGDLARFVRKLDPHHPTMFEADLDPDNAYDIIGLHYPHEMPSQRAYPNTADWLDRAKNTEASGGMLGQQGTDAFLWDRNKPLYIGEYLWTPHGDYSNSTIWFGDDAFLGLEKYHGEARVLAWTDQTLAYRRAGVTGTCPWTAFGFGAVAKPTASSYVAQTDFYKPQAAYWRDRSLRYFAGDKVKLSFDVFNDSPVVAEYELNVRPVDPASALKGETVKLILQPAEYRQVPVTLAFPAGREAEYAVISELKADGKVVDTRPRQLRTFLRTPIAAPTGLRLLVLDPSGKWPGSVKALPPVESIKVDSTLVLVAPFLVPTRPSAAIPTIGDAGPNLGRLHEYLLRGGRCVILEQDEVASLGLGVSSVAFPSTMTFPLRPNHPILTGLKPQDMQFWAPDNFVTSREIVRPFAGGAKAVVVSGGTEWLNSAPVVDLPFGAGRVILIQALAGSRQDVEPAAARLIQNALNMLAESPASTRESAHVIATDPKFITALKALKVIFDDSRSSAARLLILQGGETNIVEAASRVRETLASGGTVYWHAPTPEAFKALSTDLQAGDVTVVPAPSGVSMRDRTDPLLDGVSREDFVATTQVTGWNRQMSLLPTASLGYLQSPKTPSFVQILMASAELDQAKYGSDGSSIRFDRRSSATVVVPAAGEGVHELALNLALENSGQSGALMMLEVNGVETTCFKLAETAAARRSVQVQLRKGENRIKLRFLNGAEYGSSRVVVWNGIEVSSTPVLRAGLKTLTVPATIATWKAGNGRVVIDQLDWTRDWAGVANPMRYASAMLANLGATFEPPGKAESVESVPLPAFELLGESPHFSRSRDRISANSNAVLRTPVECREAGRYLVRFMASGTEAGGEFPRLKVVINGKTSGEVKLNSSKPGFAETGSFMLPAGQFELRVIYDNDAMIDGKDRNLVLQGVSFVRQN